MVETANLIESRANGTFKLKHELAVQVLKICFCKNKSSVKQGVHGEKLKIIMHVHCKNQKLFLNYSYSCVPTSLVIKSVCRTSFNVFVF